MEESKHCWARSVQFSVAASRRCFNEFADSLVSSLSLGTSSQSACLGFNFLVLVVNRGKPEVLQNSAEPETSTNVNPQMRYFITPGSQIILRRAEKGMKGAREQAAEGGRVKITDSLARRVGS